MLELFIIFLTEVKQFWDMHAFVNDFTVTKLASPPFQARLLDFWERLVLEERVHSSSPWFHHYPMFDWFLRFSLCGGEWWVIFIFCLSCSRVDSSEDVNHRHRVKEGKWPCLSQLKFSSLLLPHGLKNRDPKRSILKILKVAHDKFTWNGRKYHA